MDGFTTYTTNGGETWSLIAYRAYGDAYDFKTLTDANPDVAIDALLPAGIVLKVPVKAVADTTVNQALLPFWKQNN